MQETKSRTKGSIGRRINSYLRTATLLVALAVLATACGGSSDSGGQSSSGSGSGGASDESIGAILKTFANAYWGSMRQGIQDEAENRGIELDVQAARSESGTSEQVNKLEAMATQHGCFAVAPISSTNLIQPLVPISENDKPIVNLDSPLADDAVESAGITVETFIASNNERAGTIAGEHMIELLNGEGQVALIGGIPGDATSRARLEGFKRAVDESGVEIVQEDTADWAREQALTDATNIMRSNPELDGFFAANDTMALGIVQAVQNSGNDVEVIGVDGTENALQAVQNGNLSGTVSQYPYAIGAMGVEACIAAMNGEKLPKNVDAPIRLITSENADQALESFPQPFFEYKDPFADLIGQG